jgi:multiple sugar transport system ATP-binding protein
MNFLHGELVERDGKVAFATNGVAFSLDGYAASETLAAGRKVILGVRPEHIKVNELPGPGAEVHDAVVDIEEPMGADNLLWIKHAGHIMSVRINGARRFAPGAALKLVFDMSVASLFDTATELRI